MIYVKSSPRLQVFVACAFLSVLAAFLLDGGWARAQTDVPDAPTNMAVYNYKSEQLEVRWSSSDAASTTSFKVQWKSGSEEFNSSRQISIDPATRKVELQSTSIVERYMSRISRLSNGTEYTVRVIATNANGDSDPSEEATGTPYPTHLQWRPFFEQVGPFIEREVIELFENSHPWLRETWDYITSQNIFVTFRPWAGGKVEVLCPSIAENNLWKCNAELVEIGRYDGTLNPIHYTIVHELGHVYSLANGMASKPGPLGIAHLYLDDLVFPSYENLSDLELFRSGCEPSELYADALSIVTFGDGHADDANYWSICNLITDTVSDQALAVFRSAASGEMPSWFADTYNDADGNPDLERLWLDVKAIRDGDDRRAAVFQLRNSFGGYCDNQKATDSAFGDGVTRNPWGDGGCVSEEPTNVSATAVGSGKLTVSWQESPYDGGSPIEGYRIQWKSGTQEYDSSRRAVVTDLTDLQHTISGLTNDESHTLRVLAYNHNGDGAAAGRTATPTATDTTAPELLLAWFDGWVRLIWNEALDESSLPPSTAFTVTVNGVNRGGNVSIKDNVVTIGVSGVTSAIDPLTVSYTAPAGSGAMPLRDSGGNNAADFSNQSVRNDTIQVAITSDPGSDNTYSYNSGYGKQDFIEVTVTFGESVIVNGLPEMKLEIGSNTRGAAYHSGSGTSSLVFRYPVTQRDTDSDGIFIRSGGRELSKLTGPGLVRYASTKATAPARWERSLQSDHLVDGVRPTLVSADIVAGGKELDLRWDKALDEDSATGSSLFNVQTPYLTYLQIAAISIQGKVVTLTLSSAVSTTDQRTVFYNARFGHVPEDSLMEINHRPLRDTVGNAPVKTSAVVSITRNPNSPPEFPTAEDGARSVDENTPAGRNIGDPIRATDADSSRLTYSISGPDASSFDVVASSGQLRTKAALDYESRDSYSFTMSVHDGRDVHGYVDTTVDDTISVTVTVEDVDEPPEISGVTTISNYDENGAGDVAAYTASDPEGDSNISWSLGGTDQADFTITDGVLKFSSAPDYERPEDSGGNNQYEVTVQATDSTNNRGTRHVDILVQNVDEPPVITGPDTVDDFPENSATIRQVSRYTASDPEGATVTMSLAVGGADFSLAGNGVLTFGESPDYEGRSSYSVTVRAVAGSHTVDKAVTVNIQNVEERGGVTLSAVQPQEGTRLSATLDDDDGPSGTRWQWYRTSSQGSTGTAITSATSPAYTPEADDVGRYLRAVASYDDGHGDDKTATAVSANRVQEAPPQPEPPVFPADGDYNRSVRENTREGASLGAPVRATDGNNDRLTYSIPASDYFEIVSATGQLRTKAMLDHETGASHTVTVTATDPGGLTDAVAVTITVEDVDETPVVTGPNTPEVAENGGTSVATYTATDPDETGIDWVLTGSDSGAFILSGGALTINEAPDYEEKNRYRVTIEAREQGGGTSVGRLIVTVNVVNVDEPGILDVPVSEPRVGQRLTATVSDQDGGVDSVDWKWERRSTGGDWTPIPGATSRTYTPAREDNGHDLRVTAIYRDGHGPGKTETYQFARPVELRPHFDSDTATRSIQENTPADRNVGSRFTARHPDSVNLTYSLAGADGIYFDIDESNGQLKTSGTPLDYETLSDHQAEVEITATDSNGQTANISVNVAVTDECRTAGEPPCPPGRPGVSSASGHQPPRDLVHCRDTLRHDHHRLRPAIPGVR